LSKEHSALGSKEQREVLLVRALIITVENPIFGIGMNNFPSKSHERFNSGPEDWLGCHDTFLQISSELGIPGLALYLLLLWTTWKTIQSTRARLRGREGGDLPDSQQLRLLADATMVSFCGYVLFSAVAHLGYQPYYFVVAGFGQSLSFISMRVTAPAAAKLSPTPAAAA
jgi:O-antigen ligase